jgi:hypothetical protein
LTRSSVDITPSAQTGGLRWSQAPMRSACWITGRARWRHPHAPWTGAFESGCTWFDEAGQSYAVVPAASYDRCLVVCLDLDSGQPLAATPIQARAAGISPVHHPDGWVGLSEGEGQDAAQAWWVWSASQFPGQMRIEVRWRHDRERAPKGGGNVSLPSARTAGSRTWTSPRPFTLSLPSTARGWQSPEARSSAAG